MKQNEQKLWGMIANLTSPGWNVKVSDDPEGEKFGLSKLDAYIYIVDTSTGWIGAGSLQPHHIQKIHDDLDKDAASNPDVKNQVKDHAGLLTLKHGAIGSTSNDDLDDALVASVAALSATATFEAVRKTGSLAGHWINITYKMMDGASISRPAFLRVNYPGFCKPEELNEFIKKIVSSDTDATANTSAAMMIRQCGGAILKK